MTDVTLRIRGDATGVIRASSEASRAVSGIADASQQAGQAGQRAGRQIAAGAEQAAQASQQAAQAMRGLVSAAAAAFGTAQIIAAADAYTRMTGALTLATDSTAELAAMQQTLFDIAQANRAPLEATVSLYTKLSGALSEAGATSAQLASITATISQAMAISGTSAAAAEGAIQQLGQAFASGALRGDEFNSVNEAAPRLMQALAASLGVGRGELRALAEQGALTSDVLARALTGEQARKMAEEFAKLPPTLSQAAQVAQNAFTRMVGEADKAAGASATLAAGIIRVADAAPRVAEVWAAEFSRMTQDSDSFAAIFADNMDLIGFSVADVVGDIINSFAVLPATLRVFFTAVIASGDVAWALLYDGAMSLELGLQALWLQIKRAGITAFADLAIGAAGELDSLLVVVRDNATAITGVLGAISPAAGQALENALSGLEGMASLQDRVRTETASATAEIDQQIAAISRRTAEIGDSTAATITGAEAAVQAAFAERDAAIARVTEQQKANTVIAESVTINTNASSAAKANADAAREAADAAKEFGDANMQAAKGVDALRLMIDRLNYQSMSPHEQAAAEYADRMREIADAYAAIVSVGPPTAQTIAMIGEAQSLAAQRLVDDVAQIDKEMADKARQAAGYWAGAGDAIAGAFGDFVASGLKSFSDFGASLKRIAQQIISDLVRQFATSRIVVPIMAGAGFSPAAIAGATGLSPGAVAGATGGGGGMLGGLLGGIGSAIGGFSAGLGVAGSAGLAAAGNFGLASIAAGNFAVGLGALAGALGPIGLALGGINALTGGRLFGTSYRTDRAGAQFNFGESGASGFNFQEQSRRRSLFRGTARRTVESALDDDAQAQIDQFFAAVGTAVAQAAGQLGIDIPPRITASFRATTDASGNVISEVGTILGRQYNESFEAFSRRIAAENVIGVLDAALDGEAGRIAEAWRGSADTLADGAQFLLTAATDMRGGFRLLGDASLTGVAELVQRLAGDGESLTAAYQRIAGATILLDEAVSLSGVNLNMTREAFVEFAADIAEAAGGLERAQSLWASYFQTFYTEQERGLAQLTQARTRGTTQAAGLGLDLSQFTGAGGLQAFRELFESRLPTLTADQVVAWLEFGQTLGNITDLQTRYTDAVMQTAESIGQFMSGVDSALAEFAPAATLEQQLADQRASNDEMLERAVELGASEAELARVRELGDRRISAIIDSVSEQTATLTGALRLLGISATGTAEDVAVAASGLSGDFGGLFDEFLGSFYSDAERAALAQAQAQQQLVQALTAAGLSTDDLISRTELRTQIEAALAAGNYTLAEALLRVAAAMNRVEASSAAAAQSTQAASAANYQWGANVGNMWGGGGGLSMYGQGTTGIGGLSGGTGPGDDAADAAAQLAAELERIQQGLRDWLQSLTTGDLSPERPREQLRIARAELARLVALAQGGDLEAMRQLSAAGDQVLRLGQQVFRGADYRALFDEVRRMIGGVAGVGAPIGGGGPGGGGRPGDDLGDLGRSAQGAALALDMLAARAGMPPGSLSVPTPQFGGGASDQAVAEASTRPVVQELQRGRVDAAQENARLRAEIAELSARMRELRVAAERHAEQLARANDYRRV